MCTVSAAGLEAARVCASAAAAAVAAAAAAASACVRGVETAVAGTVAAGGGCFFFVGLPIAPRFGETAVRGGEVAVAVVREGRFVAAPPPLPLPPPLLPPLRSLAGGDAPLLPAAAAGVEGRLDVRLAAFGLPLIYADERMAAVIQQYCSGQRKGSVKRVNCCSSYMYSKMRLQLR